MILECSNCGAPLDAKSQGGFVKCNYCDRTHRAQVLQTQQVHTPAAWRPPPVWMPPPQFAIQVQQPFVYHQTRSASGCGAAFALLSVLAIGGAAAFFAMKPGGFASSWDGKSTFDCDGVQEKTIENVTMTEPLDKAVRASGICKLEIKNSELKGDKVLSAEGSSEIIMIGGSLELGRLGLEALHSARIELRGVTIRLADGRGSLEGVTVMRAENLGKIELSDTDVELPKKIPGEALLVDLRHATAVVIDGGEFSGRYKLFVDHLAELRVTDAQIKGVIEGGSDHVEGVTSVAAPADPLAAPPVPVHTAPPPQTQPNAQPRPKPKAPQKTSRCGCKANDLLCAQKCNR